MLRPCSKYSQTAGPILFNSNEKRSNNYFLRSLNICEIISNQNLNNLDLSLLRINHIQ